MYNVSSDYKTQINKTVRNESLMKINFGIVNTNASENSTITDGSGMFYSDASQLNEPFDIEKRYLTFEHNKFILDGVNLLPPELTDEHPYYQGFVSSEISGSDSVFTTSPVITITFGNYYKFAGLTFRFNKYFNNYPSEFVITAYNDVTVVYTSTVTPTNYEVVMNTPIPSTGFCNKIELTFNKTNIPRRRLEVEYIMFGIVATFNDTTITNASWTREVDFLSTKLPTNSLDFTILDVERNYNPDNPSGVWEYLEERQPVWFQYGYTLDDGTVEWVDASNLYSNGKVIINSQGIIPTVTFKADGILAGLDETYYKGVYNPSGISLYDLAIGVLDFANLPDLETGLPKYIVDTALQSIITKVPLPELKIKECLQLIANAGRCCLNVNRYGQVEIKRLDESTTNDFKYDFSNIKTPPVLNKVPYLLSVETFTNVIRVSADQQEVHKSEVNFSNPTECLLKYDASTNLNLVVDGTVTIVTPPVFYAGTCLVTLQGAGTLYISGYKIEYSKNSVSYINGQTGFICPVENQLLNSETDAYAYAQWVASILTRRNQYGIEDRGYPEVDIGDVVLCDTLFTSEVPCTVNYSKISYNGTLSGETKYLSKEVV